MRSREAIVLLFALACLASAAGAQTLNPRTVSFLASPDHDAIAADGMPLVTRYELQLHEYGRPTPFLLTNLGKPDPGPDGVIEIDFASVFASPPKPGIVLEARVAAVGPAGRGESEPSNPFLFELASSASNIAPTASITTPRAGSKLRASARIQLAANASDADGRVAWVSFFIDGVFAGVAVTAPYSASWPKPAPGVHAIVAVAVDDAGAETASQTISVTVTGLPPRVPSPGGKATGVATPRPPAKRRPPK